ncbi:hypothetical protein, partial [Klebsiella michiganensis]|uniref:hypothetical protein n=1 Tax=Klebsiella michiganensis TaxID=1134687 RepID=UPI001CA352D8
AGSVLVRKVSGRRSQPMTKSTITREHIEDTNYRVFWRVTVWAGLFCVIFFWLPAISVAIYYFSSGN